MNEIQLRQEASRLTNEVLDRVAGKSWRGSPLHPTACFVEGQGRRSDAPDGTRFIPMRRAVADALAARGLREPVSLTHLRDCWWVAQVDAAHIHDALEFGGAYCTVVSHTDELLHTYFQGYAEVVQGPFSSERIARKALSRT